MFGLSTFVTVACAALSMASPILPPNLLGGESGLISGLSGRGAAIPAPPSPIDLASLIPASSKDGDIVDPTTFGARDVQQPTLPEIFIDLTNKIAPIAADLEAAVSVKADIKIEVVVALLTDVVVLLKAAIVDIQIIVANPGAFVLSVAGTIITVQHLAVLVAALLSLLLPVLLTVVVAVKALAAGAVLSLVVDIGGLVAVILGLAVKVVPNLIVILTPEITAVVNVVYSLKISSLIVVLGLPASGY